MAINISNFKLCIPNAGPTKSGLNILGYFEYANGDVSIRRCVLAKRRDGSFAAWPPRERSSRTVEFAHKDAVLDAALAAYWTAGGTEGRASNLPRATDEESDHAGLSRWMAGAA
jgi:hypothetical protein